jgi:Pyruvate/2-oxoacid:ferredoxin oxidoreductase delta subunit
MSLTSTSALRVVLRDGAGAPPLDSDSCLAAMTSLLEKGFAVSRAASDAPIASNPRAPILVLAQFAPASAPVADADPSRAPVHYRDISGLDAGAITALAESVRVQSGALAHGEWKPWFPVIDYDRCTNCMQCLSFCLFGVYGVDSQQRIQAQNQENCKTNCPACSRVCPEAAIMFPKYKAGPINGDEVRPGDVGKEKMKVDISALLGGDVYSALRQRSDAAKARFSKERDEKKALTERQSCLTKLAQGGDIPMEVLLSLPSPEEIQRRAEEAKAKAAAALAAQTK